MAVNTEIWGNKPSWVALYETNSQSLDDDKKVYARENSISNYATTPIGSPIDKTVCVSGLGAESVLSNIKYLDVNDAHDNYLTPTVVPATFSESRNVTNWCFAQNRTPLQYAGLGQGNNGLVDGDNNVVNTNPLIQRYAPEPIQESGNTSDIIPFTQFSHNNLIMLIMVLVTRDFATYHFYTLSEYINSHTDENLITGVFLRPYVQTDDIMITNRVYLSSTFINEYRLPFQIAVLDEWSLPVTKPYIYGGLYGNLQGAFRIMGTVGYSVASGYPPVQCRISDNVNQKVYLAFYGTDAWDFHMDYKESNNIKGQYYRFYDESFFKECLEQAACFGVLFTPNLTTAESGDITDPDMYCGVLDSSLVGHGEYTKGSKNTENEQLNWTNSNDSTYNANVNPYTETPYEGKTSRIKAGDPIAVGGKWYCDHNLATWSGLLQWCSGLNMDESNKQQYFFGQNPIDCILESKILFVSDYTFGKDIVNTRSPIQLGSYVDAGGVGAFPFSRSKPVTFYCGKVTINKIYGDFRDLSPYTSYTLILPFASSVELPSDLVVGHTIYLEETIDPLSGDIKYHISVDDIDYMSANGNCAMNLSINGLEIATYQQSRYDLQTQKQTSEFNALASLVGGASGALIAASYKNVAGALMQLGGGAINAANSYNTAQRIEDKIDRMKPPPAKIQLSNSNVEWGDTVFPCIIASSPRMIAGYNESEYKNKRGFATYTVATIGSQEGCVICENVVLSGFKCSDSEQIQIKQMLEAGVYIKKK